MNQLLQVIHNLGNNDEKFISDAELSLIRSHKEEASAYGWNVETYLTQLYSTNIEWKYMESTGDLKDFSKVTSVRWTGIPWEIYYSAEELS